MNTNQHWLLPADATHEEKEIFLYSVEGIYNRFNDPLDKLIIALVFELGYPQVHAARIIGRKEVALSLRVKKIKTVLANSYQSHIRQ